MRNKFWLCIVSYQHIDGPVYSNGALIVSTVLGDPELKKLWFSEVKVMADRLIGMRTTLRDNLEKRNSPLPRQHITNEVVMFCRLTLEQVYVMEKKF
ncbi:hypothetical protein ACSQ67_011827 [Phaseolus vulgaris]